MEKVTSFRTIETMIQNSEIRCPSLLPHFALEYMDEEINYLEKVNLENAQSEKKKNGYKNTPAFGFGGSAKGIKNNVKRRFGKFMSFQEQEGKEGESKPITFGWSLENTPGFSLGVRSPPSSRSTSSMSMSRNGSPFSRQSAAGAAPPIIRLSSFSSVSTNDSATNESGRNEKIEIAATIAESESLPIKVEPPQSCRWTGLLSHMKAHMAECMYCFVECNFKKYGCKERLMKKNMTDHESSCNHRIVLCKHCESEGFYDDLQGHIQICPERPITCVSPGCSDVFQLSSIEHHQTVCEHKIICCPLKEISSCLHVCKRSEMALHTSDANVHFTGLIHEVLRQQKEIKEINVILGRSVVPVHVGYNFGAAAAASVRYNTAPTAPGPWTFGTVPSHALEDSVMTSRSTFAFSGTSAYGAVGADTSSQGGFGERRSDSPEY